MKLTTSFLILALSGFALAQAPATKPAAPASKPATTTKPAATSAKPAPVNPAQATPVKATPVKPTTAQATPAKTASMPAKPVTTAAKPQVAPAKATKPAQTKAVAKPATVKPAKAPVKKEATPAQAEAPADKKPAEPTVAKNRRDPFVSVVMSREGPPCSGGGKKCLAIDQVTLQGVVRSPNGSIAVVSSGANKTYFLRENDPVYNGVVVKIAPDSIIFRETVMDRLGKTSQREVVKKIRNTPSV